MNSRILRRIAALCMAGILLLNCVVACNNAPGGSNTDSSTTSSFEIEGSSSEKQSSSPDNTTASDSTTESSVPDNTTSKSELSTSTELSTTEPEPTTTEPEPTTTEPEPTTTEPEPTTTEPEPTTTEPEPTTTEPEPTTSSQPVIEPDIPTVVVGNIREVSAPGIKVSSQNGATIDYSNVSDGYIMIKMTGATSNLKVRIIYQDGTTYDYNLNMNGTYEAYSLQSGSGSYTVGVYQNNGQGRYFQVLATTVKVSMTNENNPYLIPTQRIYYTRESAAVTKSFELCAGKTTDEQKVNSIYEYIVKNVKYDYDKAASVGTNYVSSADTTLSTNKGICLDYAVLMATMLRAQGIPTQVIYGSAKGASWHAWNKVYYNGKWYLFDATFAAGGASGQNYVEVKRY